MEILSTKRTRSPTFQHHTHTNPKQLAIMAESGIDRKAEERMEFTTSKDVTVAPTFQVRAVPEVLQASN